LNNSVCCCHFKAFFICYRAQTGIHQMSLDKYPFSYKDGKFWVVLKKAPPTDTVTPSSAQHEVEAVSGDAEDKTKSYYTETGQLICSMFFFQERLDSDVVRNKISSILATKDNLKSIWDVEICQTMELVSAYIFKQSIQNNPCEFKLIDDCLTYLAAASLYLANKIGDTTPAPSKKIMSSTGTDGDYILRCSYKFCTDTCYCPYNYPEGKRKKPSKGCYSDHFPYRKLYQDVISLQAYIRRVFEKAGDSEGKVCIRSSSLLVKSQNTLSFVTKHISNEVFALYLSCNKDKSYEKLHKNLN
jgi:hypothetical protein